MLDQKDRLAALVDPRHTAVIVVDVQNDFCDPTEFPAAAQMLPRLRRFIDDARQAGALIIFTQVVHDQTTDTPVWLSRYATRPHRRQTCRAGTPGADYHPDFRPQPGDLAIVKHRYSAFIGTPLELQLRARGIQTVIMTGIATNVCVESTARDAFQRDFYVVMLADCTATNSEELQQATLENIRRNFGIVATADEVRQAWQAVAVRR